MRKITLTTLPKSWWAIYTEALLNSRGQKTENQLWWERMELGAKMMREIEDAIHRNHRFSPLVVSTDPRWIA